MDLIKLEDRVSDQRSTSFNRIQDNLMHKFSKLLVKLLMAVFCVVGGLALADRSQAWNHAKLISKEPSVGAYEGKISRSVLTGDYTVERADGSSERVSNYSVVGYEWTRGTDQSMGGVVYPLLGLFFAVLLFAYDPIASKRKKKVNEA